MKNTEKTVIEWLDEAKEQGYEWAADAIKYALEDGDFDLPVKSLTTAISLAFVFNETKEGYHYWANIGSELFKQGL